MPVQEPLALPSRSTASQVRALVGVADAITVNVEAVTVMAGVTVFVAELEPSVACSTGVNVPVPVYTWVAEALLEAEDVVPSPKSQE